MSEQEMEHRVRQQRADIDSLYGLVERIDHKVDGLDAKLSGRIDGLESQLDQRFGELGAQLSDVLRRLG